MHPKTKLVNCLSFYELFSNRIVDKYRSLSETEESWIFHWSNHGIFIAKTNYAQLFWAVKRYASASLYVYMYKLYLKFLNQSLIGLCWTNCEVYQLRTRSCPNQSERKVGRRFHWYDTFFIWMIPLKINITKIRRLFMNPMTGREQVLQRKPIKASFQRNFVKIVQLFY